MGKGLKGKELGVGICQRKDGLYTARFVSKRTGKSVQRYFPPKYRERRKTLKIKDFRIGRINYETRNSRASQRRKKHTV